MKASARFSIENVNLKFGEWCRYNQTLDEPPTVETLLKNSFPLTPEDFKNIEFLRIVKEALQTHYHDSPPLTFQEVFKEENAEKRYLFMKALGPEALANEMNPTIVSEKTIPKTQRRTIIPKEWGQKPSGLIDSSGLKFEEFTFEDTYTLMKIEKSKFNDANLDDDIFILKCNCPSTNRVYYLFIDPQNKNATTDAIEAVAWTLQMSVEDYMAMEEES